MSHEVLAQEGYSFFERFCGVIRPEDMEAYRRPDLTPDIAARLNLIQGDQPRKYVRFMEMPLRIEHYNEGPGNQVWSFIIEGKPDDDGVYSCVALSVIQHSNGGTYSERHCAKERKTDTGEIEVVEEWTLSPEDIHVSDTTDDDFIVSVAHLDEALSSAA